MSTSSLTEAEQLKFALLAEGLAMTSEAIAYIDARNGDRPMTPADYASTSGIILRLDDDVWVNAPIEAYNPNFVSDSRCTLDIDGGQLVVHGRGLSSAAAFWLPPRWHGQINDLAEPWTGYAFTHADRVRISPVEGCAITCTFCDLPYEFRYRTKRVEGLVDVVGVAATDPVQPAYHVLISGGTPRPEDYDYVREVYRSVARTHPDLPIDVMMVPIADLLVPEELKADGVAELSINIEIVNRDIARRVMPRKFRQGLDHYLDFIEGAAEVMEPHSVRSMLMVGLEPLEDTLAGVRAIAERGGVPVLSPFRPDPATPLRHHAPPSEALTVEAYLRAREISSELGVPLGPKCIPCAHNTLTLAVTTGNGDAHMHHGLPDVV